MALQPLAIKEAQAFVARHHRHHTAPNGGLFAVGINDGTAVVGCAIVGRPVARLNWDGYTAEVTRLCVLEGQRNGCSMLYRACWRAAVALGYRRLITYTLESEGGASLRASGFQLVGVRGGGTWNRADRPRVDKHPTQQKLLWTLDAPAGPAHTQRG